MIPHPISGRELRALTGGLLLWTAPIAVALGAEAPADESHRAAAALPEPIEVPTAWRLSHSLCEPETAVRDAERGAIYVSNVCGFNKDGHGFISRVSDQGELLERFWVDGLDAPAGLALRGRRLWAADVDVLREFDLDTAREVSTVTFPAELEVQALNDLVLAPDGTIYVSDSGRRAIYRVTPDGAELFLRDDRFQFVNGLHLEQGVLWVGSGRGLYTVRLEDRTIGGPVGPELLTDVDGIESDGSGGLLISIVGGDVWHLPAVGELSILTTPGLASTNLGYFPEIGLVVVPTGTDGTLLAFRFPPS